MHLFKSKHISSCLIFTRTLESDTIITPHFIDEATEAQKDWVLGLRAHSKAKRSTEKDDSTHFYSAYHVLGTTSITLHILMHLLIKYLEECYYLPSTSERIEVQ